MRPPIGSADAHGMLAAVRALGGRNRRSVIRSFENADTVHADVSHYSPWKQFLLVRARPSIGWDSASRHSLSGVAAGTSANERTATLVCGHLKICVCSRLRLKRPD